ncbi:hypothetical protein EV421DRAFT_1738444 [Armillaria borealis]|uniref:CxC2-like cysteine cluster KDZ transposase-associated domain-containing protein n=1 Tax=Armillaria borealis TaxID=47425 RepID=A0AA39JAI4_9AGAR|nr:hypothetical protein EV421DRAFT_1738444 [Armillaria borealis]
MKGRPKLHRGDEQIVWQDTSITHSRRVKVTKTGSIVQYAAGPSTHRTLHQTITIPDSHIPQEVLYDASFPDPEPPPAKKTSPKRYMNSWQGYDKNPGYRDEYLMELLCRKGRGDTALLSRCAQCDAGEPRYRCKSCPLCLLEWNGEYFMKTTLRDLGLRVQIGHFDGLPCICPERAGRTFTVMDTNGIHEVEINYCACDRRDGATRRQQLLRFGCKVSGYDFYKYLTIMTDAWGIRLPKYRHLKMLMRAGRGQEENGIETTSPGQLALRCPACPIPDVNLPAGWESASRSISFLYHGILALDANFRLKNLFCSTPTVDPGLHTGLAYFVKYVPYLHHLGKYVTQTDWVVLTFERQISTCSGFKTLRQAETKGETGLRASGVAMCVGDLQKGERYVNMDYVIMSGASSLGLQNLFISYDIACQWNINFKKRMAELPSHLRLRGGVGLSCGVPKLHAKAHKLACQCEYAIGIQDGTGRTDGEGIERTWAIVNVIAFSTKEMGPRSRHDTLDDHFAYHNFLKLVGLGHMLHKRLAEADSQVASHRKYHADFTNALPNPNYASEWTAVVEEWDQDCSKPSPYLSVGEHVTEQDLKLKLKEDERHAKARGEIPIHKISATSCLGLGLLIEDSQRRISAIVSGEGELSSVELADVHMCRINLEKLIEQFRELQFIYMPGIALRIEHERETTTAAIEAEDDKLWFPSDLSELVRKGICHAGLGEKEEILREEWKQSVHAFRNENMRGQEALAHASDVLDGWKAKCHLAAQKYRRARSSLLALRGLGSWMNQLKELNAKDMSSMYGSVLDTEEATTEVTNPEDQRQKKKKTMKHKDRPREVSWIWLAEGSLGELDDDSDVTDVRVHWLRSRARLRRWEEEVELLREEQRRVLATLRYRAKWWDDRRSGWPGLSTEVAEGVRAYAAQQREGQLALADHFTWKWPAQYAHPPDEEEDSDDDGTS